MVPRTLLLPIVVVSACVGLLGGTLMSYAVYQRLGPSQSVANVVQPGGGGGRSPTVSSMVSGASPSLVKIRTKPFRGALGDGLAEGTLGNGFVVSADGLIMTSVDVVAGATNLRIGTGDGRGFDAVVAGTDSAHGLIVLRAAAAHNLIPLVFASGPVRTGDTAVVIGGSALGVVTASTGTVNLVTRTMTPPGPEQRPITGSILVSTVVGPNDVGAPVLDTTGAVIAVATGLAQPEAAGVVGLSGRAAAILVDQLKRGSRAVPTTFGVDAPLVGGSAAAALGVHAGAIIRAVTSGGPGGAAGLLIGDVITGVNGVPVDADHPVEPTAFGLDIGQRVTLSINRSGHDLSESIVVGSAEVSP